MLCRGELEINQTNVGFPKMENKQNPSRQLLETH